jgi:uncharacterized protein (TIGR02147 family)
MLLEHVSYRSYLKALLAEKIQKNSAFSLRAMALQLGIQSSQLSEVINGRANFSLTSAVKVSNKIGLKEEETDYFCLLVQLESENDPATRDILLQKVNRARARQVQQPIQDLTVDQFKQISEWYHSAILELSDLTHFNFTPENIATTLAITKLEASVAIERLERLELLIKNENGGWTRTPEDIRVNSPHQNTALKTFYKQMLTKASDALDAQTPSERLSGYETMTFSEDAIPEAREAYEKFFSEMIRISKKCKQKTAVYHVLVHCFNLTQNLKGKKK